jgi:hypothetical protein
VLEQAPDDGHGRSASMPLACQGRAADDEQPRALERRFRVRRTPRHSSASSNIARAAAGFSGVTAWCPFAAHRLKNFSNLVDS